MFNLSILCRLRVPFTLKPLQSLEAASQLKGPSDHVCHFAVEWQLGVPMPTIWRTNPFLRRPGGNRRAPTHLSFPEGAMKILKHVPLSSLSSRRAWIGDRTKEKKWRDSRGFL